MARDFIRSSSHYLDAGSVEPLSAYPFTFSFWAKPSTVTGGIWQAVISQGHHTTNRSGWWVNTTSGGGGSDKIQIALGSTSSLLEENSASVLTVDVWSHVAIVCESSNIGFFINGALDRNFGHSQTYQSSTDHDLYIGSENNGNNTGTTSHQDGDLAEIAIYDTNLVLTQIAALAAGYTPPCVALSNLVRYWPIIGTTAPEPELITGQDGAAGTVPAKSAHTRIIFPTAQMIPFPPAAGAGPVSISSLQHALQFNRRKR